MRKQRGVTMIGWIFLLMPMAVVLYAGIRVGAGVPELLQGACTAMKETAVEAQERRDAVAATPSAPRSSKRFDTGYIDEPDGQGNRRHQGRGGLGP